MRSTPRTRHATPVWATTLLWPLFRHSAGRGAYVLRVVGGRWGPVLVTRSGRPEALEPAGSRTQTADEDRAGERRAHRRSPVAGR